VTGCPAQEGFADAVIEMLTGRFVLTISVMALEVAGFPVAQVRLEVSWQVTMSPFTGSGSVYIEPPNCAVDPLTYQWYVGGVPPLTGVAVKVTGLPWHTGLGEAVIETLTGNPWLTVIVIIFD
jgi:hypothetical protein